MAFPVEALKSPEAFGHTSGPHALTIGRSFTTIQDGYYTLHVKTQKLFHCRSVDCTSQKICVLEAAVIVQSNKSHLDKRGVYESLCVSGMLFLKMVNLPFS